MTSSILGRGLIAGLLLPALTLGTSFVSVLSAPPAAAAGEDLDALYEDMRVATTRLKYSVEKLQSISFALGGDDGQQRHDLIRRAKAAMEDAKSVKFGDVESVNAAIELMGQIRDEANAFLKSVQPLWGEGAQAYGKSKSVDTPYVEVLKFRESLEDAQSVEDGLSEDENQQVRALAQEGDETILRLKDTKESDHVATEESLRQISALRAELDSLYKRGVSERGKGFSFVPLQRAGQQWTDVNFAENEFTALRTRFIQPQSAYVTVRNDSTGMRPLFIEISFSTSTGEETGTATYETQRLEEMRPGEIREILVPMAPSHPQFWEMTRGYTLHLN